MMNKYCPMCFNHLIDKDGILNRHNDLSYKTIGKTIPGRRILIATGGGVPLRILFDEEIMRGHPETVGMYIPKYCPECGRKINEYEKTEK